MLKNLSRSSITNALSAVIVQVRKQDTLPLGNFEDFEIIHDLGLDSLQRIEMIMIAEEQFDIALQDQEIAKCITVSQVLDVLCAELNV